MNAIQEPKTQPQKKKKNSNSLIVVITIGICIILFVILRLPTVSKPLPATPTTTPQESAWYACTLGIQKELGLSILDAQNYNPKGVLLDDTFKDGTPVDFTTYTGPRQYEVDVYYAKVKSMYHCILTYYPDTKAFKLTSLEMK